MLSKRRSSFHRVYFIMLCKRRTIGQIWTVSFSPRTKSQTLQSVLCITINKYLVRVLVVLLHARFSVFGPYWPPFFFRVIPIRKYGTSYIGMDPKKNGGQWKRYRTDNAKTVQNCPIVLKNSSSSSYYYSYYYSYFAVTHKLHKLHS